MGSALVVGTSIHLDEAVIAAYGKLGLTKSDLKCLQNHFERSQCTSVVKFCETHGLVGESANWIVTNLLYLLDNDENHKKEVSEWNLEQYILFLYNVCAHWNQHELSVNIFNIYDDTDMGYMSIYQVNDLIELIWEKQSRTEEQKAEINLVMRSYPVDTRVKVENFCDLVRNHPVLLLPVFDMQRMIRSSTLGLSRWQKLADLSVSERQATEHQRTLKHFINKCKADDTMEFPFAPLPPKQSNLLPGDVTVIRMEKKELIRVSPGKKALIDHVEPFIVPPTELLDPYAYIEKQGDLGILQKVDLWHLEKPGQRGRRYGEQREQRTSASTAPSSARSSFDGKNGLPAGGGAVTTTKPTNSHHWYLEAELAKWSIEQEKRDQLKAKEKANKKETIKAKSRLTMAQKFHITQVLMSVTDENSMADDVVSTYTTHNVPLLDNKPSSNTALSALLVEDLEDLDMNVSQRIHALNNDGITSPKQFLRMLSSKNRMGKSNKQIDI